MTGTRGATSLRRRVAVVVGVPAAVLLVATFLAFEAIAAQRAAYRDHQIDNAVAHAVAEAERSSPHVNAESFQRLLGDDRLVVTRGGRAVFAGRPSAAGEPVVVTVSFPGGTVLIQGRPHGATDLSLTLTGVAATALVLLMVATGLGTALVMRAISEPISRAVAVADRLAGGDLGARMGEAGNDEFRRLARAFDGMAERLESADHSQEQFLSDLAHEIATPINGVIGLAQAALDGTVGPDQICDADVLLEEETERIRALLDDLRTLRMPSLVAPSQWELVDVGAVAESLARQFAPEAAAAGLTLLDDCRSVEVVSEPRLIERVVGNLLANAIRYTPAGGRVTVAVERRGRHVVVRVADTGVGISPAERDRIFDRFYRVDASRDRHLGGSGLGLSIARRAAIGLGGTIELDSRPGAGSEFRLVLPPTPPVRPDDPGVSPPALPDGEAGALPHPAHGDGAHGERAVDAGASVAQ